MRRVVTFKGYRQLEATLVVQRFTDQRHGNIPTSKVSLDTSPFAGVTWFFKPAEETLCVHVCKVAWMNNRMKTTMTISWLGPRSQSPTRWANQFLSCLKKLDLEYQQCVELLITAYGVVKASHWCQRVSTDLPSLGSESPLMAPCL